MLAVLTAYLRKEDIEAINRATVDCFGRDDTIPLEIRQECYREVVSASVPRACYVQVPLQVREDRVSVLGQTFCSKALAKHLKDADSCYLMAVTLGVEVDRLIAKYANVSTLKSYVVDKIASRHVESVADRVCKIFEAPNKFLTLRYSAGYGDYSIECQQFYLDVLDTAKKIGVTLTSGGMLSPTKSITAIVGVCSTAQPKTYFCDSCDCDCKGGECTK